MHRHIPIKVTNSNAPKLCIRPRGIYTTSQNRRCPPPPAIPRNSLPISLPSSAEEITFQPPSLSFPFLPIIHHQTQLFETHGLGEKVVDSGVKCRLPILVGGQARQRDDVSRWIRLSFSLDGPYRTRRLTSIHHRHYTSIPSQQSVFWRRL